MKPAAAAIGSGGDERRQTIERVEAGNRYTAVEIDCSPSAKGPTTRTPHMSNVTSLYRVGIICVAILLFGTAVKWSSFNTSDTPSSQKDISWRDPDDPFNESVTAETNVTKQFHDISQKIGRLIGQDTEAFKDDSPQRSALEWLSRHDCNGLLTQLDDESIVERYALAVFYYTLSVVTPATDSWLQREFHFMDSCKSVCDWNTNDSPTSTTDQGVNCFRAFDGRHSPTFLSIYYAGRTRIQGTLPSELGLLTNLRKIDMHSVAALEGTIPSEILGLSTLQVLDFQGSGLNGTIPTQIGRLAKLRKLDLSSNQVPSFWGTLPTEVGLLTELTALILYQNQLTGTIPTELGRLTNLQVLDLFSNSFSGIIPKELQALKGSLRRLVLYNNSRLTGDLDSLFCPPAGEDWKLWYHEMHDIIVDCATFPEGQVPLDGFTPADGVVCGCCSCGSANDDDDNVGHD